MTDSASDVDGRVMFWAGKAARARPPDGRRCSIGRWEARRRRRWTRRGPGRLWGA